MGRQLWASDCAVLLDRLGQQNENSSCWIRVSQPWAGGNWGSIWIPRIGQEVIVSFEEGDPDRPLITAAFTTPDKCRPTPCRLPDAKHLYVPQFERWRNGELQ